MKNYKQPAAGVTFIPADQQFTEERSVLFYHVEEIDFRILCV